MTNNSGTKSLRALHHLIILLSGVSLGLFVWNLKDAGSPIFYILIATCALYLSLFFSAFIISCFSGLKLYDVLKRDVYTLMPLIFFLIFPVQSLFTASAPYYNYLAAKYFSGILIIPIGSMVVFLKALLLTSLSGSSYGSGAQRRKRVYCFLFVLAGLYAGAFSYYSITRHVNLNSGIDCLGFYSQAVWLFSNFKAPLSSFYNNINVFTDHMTLILVFLSPFYRIYSDPITLLILQSVLLSSGVFPIYWLAKDNLNSNFLAISLCIGYLLYPALQFANLYDFHPVNIATPLLLFTFYFFHKRFYFKYFIFLLLALLCREDVVPIVFFLGIYIFFYERKKKIGVITISISLAWFYFAYWIFLPYITSGEHSKLNTGSFGLYTDLGSSIGEIISTILLHPLFILKKILILEKIGYIVLLLLPLCFISLFHPPTFLIGFSMIMGNMLSQNIFMSTIRFFYTATITPFIFISCIYALRFLLSKQSFIDNIIGKTGLTYAFSRSNLVIAFSSAILFSSIASSVLYGPLPYSLDPYSDEFLVKKEGVRAAKEAFKLIPPDASISAASNLGAHFSDREKVFHFPFPFGYLPPSEEPEYVFINLAKPYCGTRIQREKFNEILKELLFQRNYGVFYFKDGYTILKKGYKDKSGVNNIALTTDKPAHIVDVELNNEIDFWGYSLNIPTIRPKIPFRIVYFWKATKKTDYNYYMLIKLVDERGNIVFQHDHEPVYGLYPTSSWNKKESISEAYWIELPITVNPGIYLMYVGVSEKTNDNIDKLEDMTKVGNITVQKF
jgi:uncharacterized membrane protein